MTRHIEPKLADIDTNTEHCRSPLKWEGRERSRTSPALSVRTIVRQLFGRRREQPTCGALLVSGRQTPRKTGTHVGLSAPSLRDRQEIKKHVQSSSLGRSCTM